MLINWPKITQIPKNLSSQIVCPSPKVWDFNEKKVSLGILSLCYGGSASLPLVSTNQKDRLHQKLCNPSENAHKPNHTRLNAHHTTQTKHHSYLKGVKEVPNKEFCNRGRGLSAAIFLGTPEPRFFHFGPRLTWIQYIKTLIWHLI